MQALKKTNSEVRSFVFEFSDYDEFSGFSPDIIISATITANPSGDLNIGLPAINSPNVAIYIGAGVNGQEYQVKCEISTLNGAVIDGVGRLSIQDE